MTALISMLALPAAAIAPGTSAPPSSSTATLAPPPSTSTSPPVVVRGTPADACPTLFTASEQADLEARYGAHHLSVSVHDERSGCQYDLASERRLTTASVFKISLMAGVLLDAQDAGRGITPYEDSLLWPMMDWSDDNAAGALFTYNGGIGAINAFFARVGMYDTSTTSSTWGLSTTSARDQTELVRQLLGDRPGAFSPSSRALALHYMSSVIPSQSWGVPAGLPSGWTAALKNGFFGSTCCAWRINTVGRVSPPAGGPGYEMAVLSDQWPDQAAGVAAVEEVTRLVNARLATSAVGALAGTGSVSINDDGRLEGFGIAPGGTLENVYQYEVGLGWSGWYPHGGTWTSDQAPVVIRDAEDHLELYAVDGAGRLQRTVQLPIGQGWSTPEGLGLSVAWGPAVARDADGRMEVFVVGTDGQLRHRWQITRGGAWSEWQSLGSGLAGAPAVGVSADGRLILAVVTTAGRLRTLGQVAPGSSWSNPVEIGDDAAGRPTIGRNADGRLEVAVRRLDGHLVHAWQETWGWSPTATFPHDTAMFDQSPTLAADDDGRLEIFGVDRTGRLVHQWQVAPNGDWSPPSLVGTGVALAPTVVANDDGRLEVFALGADHALWHAYQVAPDAGWSPTTSLGGQLHAG